jgi:hypothetical protein
MGFEFDRRFDESGGEIDEGAFEEYTDELMGLFAESPEVREHLPAEAGICWAAYMMDFGVRHLGVTPATMTPAHFGEVLFDIFPRKMSCESSCAPEIVRELRAFWLFVGREFGARHAAACVRLLEGDAAARLEQALADPSNYGMAKGFFMKGQKAGFDMTTQKGMNEWMVAYNAAVAATRRGIGTDTPVSPLPPFLPGRPRNASSESKRKKRKMQRAARKRNR